MCELLGFTAAEPTIITPQLRTFFSHGKNNPHGWGLAYNNKMYKSCERADHSVTLSGMLDTLGPQEVILGHIRFATVGSIKMLNCHPFSASDNTGRSWTLIHNGTIYSASRLIPFLHEQLGDTDSERLFLYLMQCVNKAQKDRPMTKEERCRLVDELVCELSPRNKLNLMIFDGELLYVHKNMRETMKYKRIGTGYMFSTQPLDDNGWEDVPTAQLTVYKKGEKIFTGTEHDGIFVPTLQYITSNDAMNI